MLRFAGDPSYHQCSIFLPSLGPIRAVGGGERSLCVGSWMGCVAEVAEPRASPRHRPVGPALRRIRLWALSRPSAHIRACCRACGTSAHYTTCARHSCRVLGRSERAETARGRRNKGMSRRGGWSTRVTTPSARWSIALLRQTPVSKSSLCVYPCVLPRLQRINKTLQSHITLSPW